MMNYGAILLCGVVAMVIGFIWFGPLFGKLQMEMMGSDTMSAEQKAAMRKAMWGMYALQFVLALISAAIVDYVLLHWATGASAVSIAFALWVGFGMTAAAGGALWSGKPKNVAWKMFLLNTTPQLLTYLAFGLILGGMK